MERNADYITRLARQIQRQKRQIHTLKERLKIAESSLSADNREIPETFDDVKAGGTD